MNLEGMSSSDLNAPFSHVNRKDSTGAHTAKSFKSVQTSFTQKGHGWECKACSMLNSIEDECCELCGAAGHVSVDHAAKSPSGEAAAAAAEDPSTDPGYSSKSSRDSKSSKQSSQVSKRSTVDPPVENHSVTSPSGDAKGARQASLFKNRPGIDAAPAAAGVDVAKKKHNKSRKKDAKPHHDSKLKSIDNKAAQPSGGTVNSTIITGAQAIQSLSAVPLPGEGTTQAIAQLLGLTLDSNHCDNTTADGDTTVNATDSKYSAGSNSHRKSVKSEGSTTAGTGKSSAGKSQQQQQQQQHVRNKSNNDAIHANGNNINNNTKGKNKQRRTTFSTEVHDISNGIKLNKKIQGDRDRVDKIKAVKRGEVPINDVANHDNSGQEEAAAAADGKLLLDSDLCAGAKPFVPGGGGSNNNLTLENHGEKQQQQQHVNGSKGRKKKDRGKRDDHQQQQQMDEKQPRSNGVEERKVENKQSKKKDQQQHQKQSEPSSDINLTLQAIQQSKQKKESAAKQRKDKQKNERDGHPMKPDEHTNTPSADDTPKVQKMNKKQQPKPKSDKQNPKTKQDKSKEKTNPKAAKTLNAPSNLSPSIPPNQPQTTNDLNYGAGRPIVVVHIAEKPSIAQAIAQGLNGGGSTKSVGRSLPTHEFTNPPFPKAPKASKVTHRVSSVAGHVFNVDFPKEYQSWDTIDPAELFNAPLVKKPCKGSVVKHLQDIAKGSDFIVLWMDCDREGENINFEVLDCISGLYSYDRVYRAHFSAINPSDIIKAYSKLGKPDRNQSLSVDARQELDLKVGVAFSRFQTRYFQGRYGDLDSAVLSFGPCQTPTLGFCVQRHLDIETFKPEPYWSLDLGVMNGSMCRATWDSGRSFNRNKVEEMLSVCRNASPAATAKVTSLVSKEKKQGRPLPLNTVGLLKACSKALGIGPHQALNIAERLYLSGYLSYPRTESTRYPSSFDIKGTLQSQTSDSRWGPYVADLLKKGANVGKGGVDMGDHPPITPCRHARAGELSGDSARVYDLVARHFIASVSEDAVFKSTTICLSIEELGEKGQFTIRGKQMVSPGFLAIVMYKQYGDEQEDGAEDDDEEEKVLPEFQVGDQFGLTFPGHAKSGKVNVMPGGKHASLDVKERMTTPPTYLTESELISKMEHHGIGTDASISTHIENILKRNYVELISGRKLKPSRLGLVLAQGYHLIDDSLVLPKIRSDIEDQCVQIAKGLADKDAVVKRAIEIFSSKFSNFTENITKMDVLFSSSFAQLQDVGKPFTRCGLTRRYLQFITGPPPRLYNKTTETVYPLPIGGEIKQWTGRNCPVEGCNFELCLYSVGAPARTFPLCPNCFNNPKPEWGVVPGESAVPEGEDAEDEAKERKIRTLAGKNMIRECPHPDNHPLIAEMTVSPDPESDGVLILDPHLGPKWRLVSTREPTIVHLPKSVDKVTILDKKDEVFECHMMAIEFKTGESPIEGKTKYTSCFANDEILQKLVRVHHGDDKLKSSSHGRGRGGRGRGGHGRGRGGRTRR